ncbi:sortilin-like [Oscarella lobularis]|uniref:sortilin-like n=1 Tax=Oscarella lobularis TaxID=121494 RepID=UPI003314438F
MTRSIVYLVFLISSTVCLELWEPQEDMNVMYRDPSSNALRHARKRRSLAESPSSSSCQQDAQIPTVDYTLQNETNRAIEIKWVGKGGESILALTTQTQSLNLFGRQMLFANPSRLWRWDKITGKFVNMSGVIRGEAISDPGGILQSPIDPDYVLLIAFNRSKMHVSYDGGKMWKAIDLSFKIRDVKFHPIDKEYALALSSDKKLYVSTEFGQRWGKIKDNVDAFFWDQTDTSRNGDYHAYASVDVTGRTDVYKFTLREGSVRETKTIFEGIYRFLVLGKFILVSSSEDQKQLPELRGLNVSEDGGLTWNRGKLPESKPGDYYKILDATKGFIMIHIAANSKSTGTLYASDGSGTYFNPVLKNHLHAHGASDFYRVFSMEGTYISSIAASDQIIQTVISFDRGGHWQHIAADPEECSKQGIQATDCQLHLHGSYSQSQGVQFSQGILSNSKAAGIIIAHGNLGKGLKYTGLDIYMTRDGGYTWTKVLDGPHRYQMADSGSLIAAIPHKGGTALYYSMDWGACWQKTTFTLSSGFHVTGLLIEPSLKSLSTSVWGYFESDNMWRVSFVDFSARANRKCTLDDYDVYTHHIKNDKNGCIFGHIEKYRRRKKDRICYNGADFDSFVSSQKCSCTPEDFECDYGYKWEDQSFTTCIEDGDFKVAARMYCKPNQLVYNKTRGYRRIPGDKCQGGVLDQFISTQTAPCSGNPGPKSKHKTPLPPDTTSNTKGGSKGGSSGGKVAAAILIPLALIVMAICGFYVYKKCYKRGGERKYDYKYSMLSQGDEDKSNLLDDLDDDDDEFKS